MHGAIRRRCHTGGRWRLCGGLQLEEKPRAGHGQVTYCPAPSSLPFELDTQRSLVRLQRCAELGVEHRAARRDFRGVGDRLGKGEGDCACAGSDAQSANKGAHTRTAASALAAAIPLLLRESRDAQPINAGSQKTEKGSVAPLKYHSKV